MSKLAARREGARCGGRRPRAVRDASRAGVGADGARGVPAAGGASLEADKRAAVEALAAATKAAEAGAGEAFAGGAHAAAVAQLAAFSARVWTACGGGGGVGGARRRACVILAECLDLPSGGSAAPEAAGAVATVLLRAAMYARLVKDTGALAAVGAVAPAWVARIARPPPNDAAAFWEQFCRTFRLAVREAPSPPPPALVRACIGLLMASGTQPSHVAALDLAVRHGCDDADMCAGARSSVVCLPLCARMCECSACFTCVQDGSRD